jgi:hypothetical protein
VAEPAHRSSSCSSVRNSARYRGRSSRSSSSRTAGPTPARTTGRALVDPASIRSPSLVLRQRPTRAVTSSTRSRPAHRPPRIGCRADSARHRDCSGRRVPPPDQPAAQDRTAARRGRRAPPPAPE